MLFLLGAQLKITDAVKPFKEEFMSSRFAYRAESLYYAGNYQAAAREFERLVKEYEFSVFADRRNQVKCGLGWSYIHLEKYQKAKEQLTPVTISVFSPRFEITAYYGLGVAAFNMGDYKTAYKHFARLTTTYPEFSEVIPDIMYYQGLAAFAMEAYGDAVKIWERLLERYPRSKRAAKTALKLADLYMKAGMPEKAREKLEWFREKFAGTPEAAYALVLEGNILAEEGNYKEALDRYDKCVAQYPRSDAAKLAQAKMEEIFKAHSYEILADTAFLQAHPRVAASLEYFPGLVAYNEGRYLEAYNFLTQFVQNHPDDPRVPDALALAAECALKKERPGDALPLLERLLTQFPQHESRPKVLFALGVAHMALENWRDAVRFFDMYLRENPSGQFVAETKKRIKAIAATHPEALEGYTFTDPELATLTLYASAVKALEAGDTLRAAHLFSQFIQQHPQDPKAKPATLLAARLYYSLGDYIKAFELAKSFLDKFPGDTAKPTALYVAGSALLAQKDYNGALAYYDQLVLNYPDHQLAQDAKKRMQAILYEHGGEVSYRVKAQGIAEEALLAKASKLYKEGQKAEAARLWVQFALKNPQHPKAQDLLIAAAQTFLELKDYKGALDAAQLYLERWPQGKHAPSAKLIEALVYSVKGSFVKALDIFQEIILQNPNAEVASKAEERAKALIATYADSLQARGYSSWRVPRLKAYLDYVKAAKLLQSGDTLGAAQAFYQFASQNPTSPEAAEALYSAGYFFFFKGKFKEAKDALEALLGQFPAYENKETALFLLGASLFQLELYDGAISTLQSYLRQFPEGRFKADAMKFLGFAYLKKERPQDAKPYLQGAEALYRSQGKKAEANEIRKILRSLK